MKPVSHQDIINTIIDRDNLGEEHILRFIVDNEKAIKKYQSEHVPVERPPDISSNSIVFQGCHWEMRKGTKMSDAVILKLIDIGGRKVVLENIDTGYTLLCKACVFNSSVEVISKIIEVGGRHLVLADDDCGNTVFYRVCCNYNPSVEIITKMIEIVEGEDPSRAVNNGGFTALHVICDRVDPPIEVISKLLEIGGRKLLWAKNDGGDTALHCACQKGDNAIEVVSKLIELGGRKLVLTRNYSRETTLHWTCRGNNTSDQVVSKLIEIGGDELVVRHDHNGKTALHWACSNNNVSIDIISNIINNRSEGFLLDMDNDGHTAFDKSFYGDNLPAMECLLKDCLRRQIGGEFAIGGIFNSHISSNGDLYNHWQDRVRPCLQQAIKSLGIPTPPLLQAALQANAPARVIDDIIDNFEDCIMIRDTLGRFPIQVAVEIGIDWHEGLEHIVNSMSIAQHRPSLYVAVQYGAKWNGECMKELAEFDIAQDGRDPLSGLRLFMLAASGGGDNKYDLDSIYTLIKMDVINVRSGV